MNAYVGLDIGGTSVKVLGLDEKQEICFESSFATNSQQGIDVFLKACKDVITKQTNTNAMTLAGIGIGCTGPIDYRNGMIDNPYTLPGLEGHSISNLLSKECKVPVLVDNDANTAHVGEVFQQPHAPKDTLMIAFGTGVGVSVRLDGELFRIPGGIHPEIGHIATSIQAEDCCYCGRNNCMEHILSGTGINKHALVRYGSKAEEAMETSDGLFAKELEKALFDSISTLAILFHPTCVYIGGGMQRFFETYLLKPVQQRLDALLPVYGRTSLEPCLAGTRAGSLGAALMAYHAFCVKGDEYACND